MSETEANTARQITKVDQNLDSHRTVYRTWENNRAADDALYERIKEWLTRGIVFALVLLALGGCGGERAAVIEYLDAAESTTDKWADAYNLAGQTPRGSIGPAIADLQEIRREFGGIEPPEVAQDPHQLMLDSMDLSVEAYMDFMRDDNETWTKQKFDRAAEDYDTALRALVELRVEYAE
jgi:hypothetical protein